jgi:hypothetical protein
MPAPIVTARIAGERYIARSAAAIASPQTSASPSTFGPSTMLASRPSSAAAGEAKA